MDGSRNVERKLSTVAQGPRVMCARRDGCGAVAATKAEAWREGFVIRDRSQFPYLANDPANPAGVVAEAYTHGERGEFDPVTFQRP